MLMQKGVKQTGIKQRPDSVLLLPPSYPWTTGKEVTLNKSKNHCHLPLEH
jgi:hypothetical protein